MGGGGGLRVFHGAEGSFAEQKGNRTSAGREGVSRNVGWGVFAKPKGFLLDLRRRKLKAFGAAVLRELRTQTLIHLALLLFRPLYFTSSSND